MKTALDPDFDELRMVRLDAGESGKLQIWVRCPEHETDPDIQLWRGVREFDLPELALLYATAIVESMRVRKLAPGEPLVPVSFDDLIKTLKALAIMYPPEPENSAIQ